MRVASPFRLLRVAVLLVPVLAWAADSHAPPRPSLDEVMAPILKDRLFSDAVVGLQVVDVATGQEVLARGADRLMSPASTMKVITSAAALRSLGPAYRFSTRVLTDGELQGGTLEGNLYVVGGGDPTMVVEKLWKLVYDLKLAGVDRVTGDVVFDDTFLTDDYTLPGWDKAADVREGPSYFPPIGALSLNFNTISVVVGPGAAEGDPGRVLLETPTHGYATVSSTLVTGARGGRRKVEVEREVRRDGVSYSVEGSIPEGARAVHHYRTVSDPTAYFMGAFQEYEAVHGVKVAGSHRRGEAPDDARELIELESPPLSVVLMDTNKYSNNFMAETVLRTMGAEIRGDGTTEAGLSVVTDYLTSIGVPPESFTLVNGSGLTREGRLTPSVLTAVLLDMAHDPRVGHEFIASLSIAGQDGTLWRRLEDASGRLRGKTGTIDGVHCLAGYVESDGGEIFAFAFLVNDVRGSLSKVRDLHDAFVRRLVLVGDGTPEG